MKKKTIIFLSVGLLLALVVAACAIDMYQMSSNKPVIFSTWGRKYAPPLEEQSITGIVREVYESSFLMLGKPTEGYPNAEEYSVSLNVENEDSYTAVAVGDEVIVYHNGEIAESDPLQINTVYAIALKTAAGDTENTSKSAMIVLEDNSEEFSSNNAAFSMALDSNTSLMNCFELSENERYWLIRIENTGNGKIVVEIDGNIHSVEAGKTAVIYSTEQWEAGTYTVSLASVLPDTMQGNAICFVVRNRSMLEQSTPNITALPKELPGLTISCGKEEITAWVGGHAWIYEDEKGEKNAITADSNHPLRCMETMSFIPVHATTVSHAVGYEPGQVTLNFDVEPTKITVYRYDVEAAEETAGEEIIMDNGYILDLAYGNYLYHIAAEWDYPEELGGSGDYAFYTKATEIYNPQAE